MGRSDKPSLTIDLDQFKLHLNHPGEKPLTLHFDTPSRRFYLSVIALVVEEMRKKDRTAWVHLEDHTEILAFLNETVGSGAGSSNKKSLLPRIYAAPSRTLRMRPCSRSWAGKRPMMRLRAKGTHLMTGPKMPGPIFLNTRGAGRRSVSDFRWRNWELCSTTWLLSTVMMRLRQTLRRHGRGFSISFYHWVRDVFPLHEISTPLTLHIVRQSNIESTGLVQVDRFPGIGSSGAKDMAGNVREWCWNAVGGKRYCQGGMWQDATYMFNNCVTPSAWDRSAGNGFRCVVYPEDAPVSDELLADMDVGIYDSREAFEAMKALFACKPTPLRSVIESRQGGGRGWPRKARSGGFLKS